MGGKINKAKKDLASLQKTILTLQERNDKLKNSLILKQSGKLEETRISRYHEKMEDENKSLWECKNELRRIEHNLEQEGLELAEKEQEIEHLREEEAASENAIREIQDESDFLEVRIKEAEDARNEQLILLQTEHPSLDLEESDFAYEAKLLAESLKHEYLLNSMAILCQQNPEMKEGIESELIDIAIPSRPHSEGIQEAEAI